MKHYEARENTIPGRALEYLKKRPDEWVSTDVLATAADSMSYTLRTSMEAAYQHGAVQIQKRGRVNFYRLGDGTKPDRDQPDDEDKALDAKGRRNTKTEPLPMAASIFDLGDKIRDSIALAGPIDLGGPGEPADTKGTMATVESPDGTRFAVWSDGTIDIEHAGEVVSLTKAESRALARVIRGQVL